MNEDTITNQPAVPEAGRPNFESGSQPQPWALGLTAEEEEALDRAKNDPDQKVFVGVRPLNKLGRFEVILLILNRCIGLFFKTVFRVQINSDQVLECSCRHPLLLRTQKALGSQ